MGTGAASIDKAPSPESGPSPFALATLAIGFLASYVGLEWLSFLHEHRGLPITPWNPGLGVAFALIVWGGWFYGALFFLGVILAEWLVLETSLDWPHVVLVGLIYAGVYSAIGHLARRRLSLEGGVSHLSDVTSILFGGIVGAAVVALLLSLLLQLGPRFTWDDIATSALPLLIGDLIGIAVVTPLLLRLLYFRGRLPVDQPGLIRPEILIYVAIIAGTMWLIGDAPGQRGFGFFYLLFVPVVMAAIRYGLDGALIALAFTQFCLVFVLQIYGTDARAFTEFQTLMFVLTGTGLVVGVVVSERRNADRLRREAEARIRAMQSEAAQEARFHLVSSMASVLAHEINQPLTAARALVRTAEHLISQPEPDLTRARGNLTTVLAQIDHAGNVLRRIRDFLSRKEQNFGSFDPGDAIAAAISLIRADADRHRVQITLDIPPGLPPAFGDRVQIQQVLLNLVRNAIEAITATGRDDGAIRVHAEPAGNDTIQVAVTDNGPGLDSEAAARAFDPLATSKRDGLGLGLAISASIMELHNGRVWLAHSSPGCTEFRLSLNRADRSTDA